MPLGTDQQVHWRLRTNVFECHHEVIFMNKLRGCFTIKDSAKKTRLLHGLNLTHFGLGACTALLVLSISTRAQQQPEVASYEGQVVSSVELAGRPDLNSDEYAAIIAQR